jgi:hypothetical protein
MMKSVAVVLLVTVLPPSMSAAGSPYAQTIAWETVEQLRAGSRLRLVLTDGSVVTGKLVHVQSDAVTLADASLVRGGQDAIEIREPRAFPMQTISTVQEIPQKRMSSKAKILTIGAIAGGAVAGYYMWLLPTVGDAVQAGRFALRV